MKRMLLVTLALLTWSIVACEVAPPPSSWTETSFSVGAGEKHTVAVQLQSGRSIEGNFSVSGAEDYIDFYVNGPSRAVVYGVVRAQGGAGFTTEVHDTGTYLLVFDNAFSFGSAREISLRYRTR